MNPRKWKWHSERQNNRYMYPCLYPLNKPNKVFVCAAADLGPVNTSRIRAPQHWAMMLGAAAARRQRESASPLANITYASVQRRTTEWPVRLDPICMTHGQ